MDVWGRSLNFLNAAMLLKNRDCKLFVKDLVRVWPNPYQNPRKKVTVSFFEQLRCVQKIQAPSPDIQMTSGLFYSKSMYQETCGKLFCGHEINGERPQQTGIFFVIIFLEFTVRTYLRREKGCPKSCGKCPKRRSNKNIIYSASNHIKINTILDLRSRWLDRTYSSFRCGSGVFPF